MHRKLPLLFLQGELFYPAYSLYPITYSRLRRPIAH